MKKSTHICGTILLLVSILVNVLMFPLNTYAETAAEEAIPGTQVDTLYKTSNYATFYFYNLHSNFGYNLAGSCGYVAAGMILTFYDVYWNSKIVAKLGNTDAFLQQSTISTYPSTSSDSPGGVSDFEICTTLNSLVGGTITVPDYSDYYSFIIRNSNSYFHFYLLSIGNAHNLWGYSSANLGLSQDQLYDVLDLYITLYAGNESLKSFVTLGDASKPTYDETKQAIADLIDDGIPVLITAYDATGNAHAMIAYDYSTDENGNIELYAHMGYTNHPELTHVSLSSTGFTSGLYALYLDVSGDHFCGGNYIRDDGITFCSCALSIHPEHIHSYTFKPFSSTHHLRLCTKCGSSTRLAHAVRAGENTCIRCGAIVSVDVPIIVPGVNNISYTLNHDMLPYIATYITENGSYVLSNEVIVLQDEDVQDYLDGKLPVDNVNID